ncbi:MAG: HD domain-containing protein [Lachnospiraceae bacterium]|nr:HD domain-containing protein [Lachnospiraceae bacterium]
MKTVAVLSLQPDMILAEDVLGKNQEIIVKKEQQVNDVIMQKLKRHNIVCVNIHEPVDYADTHYESIVLSDAFKKFSAIYTENLQQYKKLMDKLVNEGIEPGEETLFSLHQNICKAAPNKDMLHDYLYNRMAGEDDLTYAHCLNSALLASIFADWLGLSDEQTHILIGCAFFYDIGKLLLPHDLIWKPDKLTDEEYEQIKTHTVRGFHLLKSVHMPQEVLITTVTHQERCDGTGYPLHLRTDKIDLYSRYIAIIDVYEALISPRTYRSMMNTFQTIETFEKIGMQKFDSNALRVILSHVANNYVGQKVRLSNGTIGTVEHINNSRLSKPVIREEDGNLLDLRAFPELEIDAIL